MNTIATIEPWTPRAPYGGHDRRTRQSKELALAGAFKIIAGDLRSYLANIGILIEVAQAYKYGQSLARSRPGARDTANLMQRLDEMVSAVVQNTRRTGDPFGFRSHLVDLHDVLGVAVRLNRPLSDSRAVSLLDDGKSPVALVGDRRLLLEVADVLVANAIRRSPQGGRVTCLADLRRGLALLHVVDEGEAMNDRQISRTLRPFCDATVGGADVGPPPLDLWYARLIAERHGGRIVAGAPVGGRGNLFTLSLPAELC
jgi:two-component system, OmpR family, sensor histidine kinase SenX3